MNFLFYGIALGYGPVHMWRSQCQLEVLYAHVQLLFTLGSDSKLRLRIYKTLFWDRILYSHSYCVLSVDQAFVKVYTCKYCKLEGGCDQLSKLVSV